MTLAFLFVFLNPTFAQWRKKNKSTSNVESKSINYQEIGAPLPEIKFFSKEGKYLTQKDLESEGNLLIMLFNPTCDHCEDQTILFRDNIFLFKKTKIVLVAGSMMKEHLEYFSNNTKISSYPSIQLSVDSCNYIEKVFQYKTLPQLNFYDKNRKLTRIFSGSTPLDSLKQYID